MVAEQPASASATVRQAPGDALLRTPPRRRAKPSGPRGTRPTALRLVATDGRLVRQRPGDTPVVPAPQPTPIARTPVRLTRRGRLVVTAAAVLAIGATSIGVAGAAQATGHSGAQAGSGSGVAKVEIRPGQSLWSVAEAYDPDADTRVVIREILQLNSLSSDQVQPGQVLWVPRD
jgi:hypothetical protein